MSQHRGLALWDMQSDDLVTLRKNDARKVALGAVLRRRTTVSNQWIARELHLGHVSRVSRCWGEENERQA